MMQKPLQIAVIGFGYWGPNLVRNFEAHPHANVRCVVDARPERLQQLKQQYPAIHTSTQALEVIRDTQIDAVVIATPVFTHFELAKAALEAGKHVLVEKPMVTSVKEADILIEIATQRKLTLMVDHTYLYTGAVEIIKDYVDEGKIGNLQYIDSTRINLGLFQPDVNVLWDLAPHDISILQHLVKEAPYSVQATGISHTNNGIENIAYLTVNYQSNRIAHFNCSWTSPVKIRKFLIGGDEKMIVFDDTEPTEKIRVYDTRYHYTERRSDEDKRKVLVDYRVGDIHIPKVPLKEALAGVAADFIHAILHQVAPLSSAWSGRQVVQLLEASQQSIKNGGKEIIL
jgi:predicted dehydrogenase